MLIIYLHIHDITLSNLLQLLVGIHPASAPTALSPGRQMRRSLSQIQESGGARGGGGGAGCAGGPAGPGGPGGPARAPGTAGGASAGSVLRRRTLPRFFSMVACGQRATEPGRRHGPAAGPAPDPRFVFFSIVACRSHTPAHLGPTPPSARSTILQLRPALL